MASGDKIYIADKETLNSVKEDTNAVRKVVENLPDTNPGDYITAAEIVKLRYGQMDTQSGSTSTWRDYINIQGSGEIYGVLYENAVFTQLSGMNYFKITVDGIIVYTSSNGVAGPHCYGLLTPEVLVYGTTPYVYVPNGAVQLGSRSIITKDSDAIPQTTNSLLYLPRPLKFTKSLKISAYTNYNTSQGAVLATPGKIYYMYKLD